METAEPWKAWKTKSRFPTPPPAPWKSRALREIPTFPQPRRSGMEKWKTKSRFPTFPFRFATTTSVLHLPNPTAYGRQSRRRAAHRAPSWSPDSNFMPNRKELFPGLQRLRFSGSSCIGNESRFQDHLSIGICCPPRDQAGLVFVAPRSGPVGFQAEPSPVAVAPQGRYLPAPVDRALA